MSDQRWIEDDYAPEPPEPEDWKCGDCGEWDDPNRHDCPKRPA